LRGGDDDDTLHGGEGADTLKGDSGDDTLFGDEGDDVLEKFMDKKGPYIWKDSYIFCMDDEAGKILAHPVPRIIGFPMKNWKDADGKQPFEQPIAEISTKKSGWIKYYYRAPGAETPRLKVAYFLKVPGEKAIVSAGYYE